MASNTNLYHIEGQYEYSINIIKTSFYARNRVKYMYLALNCILCLFNVITLIWQNIGVLSVIRYGNVTSWIHQSNIFRVYDKINAQWNGLLTKGRSVTCLFINENWAWLMSANFFYQSAFHYSLSLKYAQKVYCFHFAWRYKMK